ncbi:hypothetical protein Pcinc_044343 [Petrolisthes cinctipes]|uniref:Uncharacterized protein n=1 Tax=Petrolisthes cinctipes TaxID=88211 RepID=A0AAE1BH08_PETCI|nr:hypothetical protein Pcinc_044343 [Petrolisthes cinctipes]
MQPASKGLTIPGEEGDRSFRDLCDLSDNDSEGGSVSPREPLSSPHAHRSSPTPTNPNSHHDLNMNAAGAAAELSAAAQRFITQQLSTVPMELELRPSGSGVGLGVWTKQTITRGTRYGPFLGKWTANAKDPSFAWEPLVPTPSLVPSHPHLNLFSFISLPPLHPGFFSSQRGKSEFRLGFYLEGGGEGVGEGGGSEVSLRAS